MARSQPRSGYPRCAREEKITGAVENEEEVKKNSAGVVKNKKELPEGVSSWRAGRKRYWAG